MADPLTVGALVSGAASGAASFLGDIYNIWSNESSDSARNKQYAEQMAFAREQFDYQKAQNLLTQQREDTAYQRKVNDLVAAGLNPLLAVQGAGSQASTAMSGSIANPGRSQQNAGSSNTAAALNAFSGNLLQAKMVANDTLVAQANANKDNAEAERIRALIPGEVTSLGYENSLKFQSWEQAESFFGPRLMQMFKDLGYTDANIRETNASTLLKEAQTKQSDQTTQNLIAEKEQILQSTLKIVQETHEVISRINLNELNLVKQREEISQILANVAKVKAETTGITYENSVKALESIIAKQDINALNTYKAYGFTDTDLSFLRKFFSLSSSALGSIFGLVLKTTFGGH